jgi:hypothetical protein
LPCHSSICVAVYGPYASNASCDHCDTTVQKKRFKWDVRCQSSTAHPPFPEACTTQQVQRLFVGHTLYSNLGPLSSAGAPAAFAASSSLISYAT